MTQQGLFKGRRSKQREDKRGFPIKDGAISELEKNLHNNTKPKIAASKASFESYCENLKEVALQLTSVKKKKKSFIGIHIKKNPHHGIATITVSAECRMSPSVGQSSAKITVSEAGIVADLLNHRSLQYYGIEDCKKYHTIFIVNDVNEVLVLWLRNRLSLDEARSMEVFYKDYDDNPGCWTMGCEGQNYADFSFICEALTNKNAHAQAGLNSETNVVSVQSLGTNEKTGITNKVVYTNAEGETISRPLNKPLKRKSHTSESLEQIHTINPSTARLHETLESIYKEHLPDFLTSWGVPSNHLDEVTGDILKELGVTANVFDCHSNIGQHQDIPAPSPALLVGTTNYMFDESSGKWVKKHKGGNLYLADGMILLDYKPQDVILMDANILHGITNIKGGNPKSYRLSLVYFSRYKRPKKMMNYGNYHPSSAYKCLLRPQRKRKANLNYSILE